MASCDDLGNNPELGRNYDIVTRGILGFKSGEHIIFYSIISKNEIEIARILYAMMVLKSRL
ncbi:MULTISPECIES: type II toxin-antitoxin system RelE/ParE family toxin [Flavobacterium]|uniref:type II toxin-antitoxin system RelE/ParE family toxin n=1 Tax=Flavobacterium TaxID=237 RepID=UPI0029CAAC39|nr:type II toxin-antitoxin system RelE/ParE family toxin [Flavobacterium sp. N503310]